MLFVLTASLIISLHINAYLYFHLKNKDNQIKQQNDKLKEKNEAYENLERNMAEVQKENDACKNIYTKPFMLTSSQIPPLMNNRYNPNIYGL